MTRKGHAVEYGNWRNVPDELAITRGSYSPVSNNDWGQYAGTVRGMPPLAVGENNDGNRQEWLFGEERMTLQEAAKTMISRAGEGVREIMRNLGIEVDVPAVLSQKKAALPSHRAVLRCISQSVEEVQHGEYHYSSSTPVGQKRPPRVSFPCSQIAEDSAMELFSSSIMELSLDENDDAPIEDAEKQEDGEQYDEEVQDLETSLLKAGASFVEDSFDQPVEFVRWRNTQKPRTAVHDSFDEPLSQLFLPKTQIPKRRERLSMASTKSRAGDSVVDMSADLFESFEKSPSTSSSNKRSRSSIECWSPTVSSPLCKSGRRSDKPSHLPQFHIEDICRSESSWNAFVAKSSQWEEVAMCVVQRGDQVAAVAFCHKDEMPVFIPLSDDDYAGCGSEEVNYPSATPCQNISIRERRAHVGRILGRAGVLFFDALSQCKSLRDSLEIEVVRPVCIEYLSFLGHYRTGEVPLSIGQLASRFDWPFNVQQLLRMSPRINASVQAFICSRIFDRLHAQAVSQSSKEAVQLEISSIRTVAHISSVGFPFSRRLCTEMVARIRGKMDSLEEECHQLAGKFFNLESAPSVSEVLFSRLKIPHPGGIVAGKRHLSANKLILAQIVDLHPIVPKIIQFRQLKHAISQCLLPLLGHVSSDDVIRTSFDIATATGRILSKNPSVQTVPKGQIVDNFAVRSLFSSVEGRLLIAADYCQLELRVLAHLSADPALLKQLSREDRDFFHELSQKWGFPRDSVKQLCYGLIYGMGVKALADATKLAVLEAQRLQDSFFDAFPKVKTYISTTRERAETVGFVTTFLGRRRVACTKGRQEDRSRDHRQSVNFTIQGTASEIFKKAITSIHARLGGLDAAIVMIVHDEIIVDCRESIQSTVAGILRQEMENVFPSLRVPLQVKVAIGSNWAELK